MFLPGDNAKDMRSKISKILLRYFAGDPTLLEDIEANAASDSPICKAARASLQSESLLDADGFTEESLIKRRKLTDELTVSARVSTAEVRELTGALTDCNPVLEKHIDLKERSNNVDIKFEHDKLGVEHAKLALLSETRRQELEWKRACRDFDAEAPPAQLPQETTTVLKVYEANRASFQRLNQDKRSRLLRRAGVLAAQRYREQRGRYPSRQDEGKVEVNAYPLDAQHMLLQCIQEAYRETMTGSAQQSINAAFAKASAQCN
jgi:hypothetical protein